MVNFLRGFTIYLMVRVEAATSTSPSCRLYEPEAGRSCLPARALQWQAGQFLPEVFPHRIQINILNLSVEQMIMAPFRSPFSLTYTKPVGCFVAGTFKAIFFHEGLQ